MPDLIKKPTKLFPIWLAIKGQKIIAAQLQEHAIDSFMIHYGEPPTVVINGLFAGRTDDKDNDRGGGLGQG